MPVESCFGVWAEWKISASVEFVLGFGHTTGLVVDERVVVTDRVSAKLLVRGLQDNVL